MIPPLPYQDKTEVLLVRSWLMGENVVHKVVRIRILLLMSSAIQSEKEGGQSTTRGESLLSIAL